MVADHLSDELTHAGALMTAELDKIGLEPQGALWAYRHELRDWRFCVISDLVPVIGRIAVYDLLGRALDAVGPIEGLTIFDVHLYEPSEVFARVLGGTIGVSGISQVALKNCVLNGERVDGLVYRLLPPRPNFATKKAASTFRKSVNAMAPALP